MKVLVVEDDPVQSYLIDKILTSEGHNVIGTAHSGKTAIEMASKYKPELITMDIMLSDDIDGIQAAVSIQKIYKPTILYLSGNKDSELLQRANKTSYYKYLRKPFYVSELREVFKKLKLDYSNLKSK